MSRFNPKNASPKMSLEQAKIFWNSLSPEQRLEFNKLLARMNKGELMLSNILVDDNEQIQRIVLEEKDKPSKPVTPFMGHFKE